MFDLNKIRNAAERIGLDLEFNSENPGMHFIMSDGSIDKLTFSDLQASLNKEFKKDPLKPNTGYKVEYKSSLRLDIDSNHEESGELNEIKVSVGGHSKTSNHGKLPSDLDDGQYMHYNTRKNNGAA